MASDLNRQLPKRYFAEANLRFNVGKNITDMLEVSVYSDEEGPTLVGAVEIVSPTNKDSPEHREAFVEKCTTILRHGIGLVIVDIVTERTANLHCELCDRLRMPSEASRPGGLYASAYRAIDRDDQSRLEIWYEQLAVGFPLPVLPLWLSGAICLRIDLDGTYQRTCEEQRVAE